MKIFLLSFCYCFLFRFQYSQRIYSLWFKFSLICRGLFYDPGYTLTWHMFHGHLKWMCILQLLGRVFYKYCFDHVGWVLYPRWFLFIVLSVIRYLNLCRLGGGKCCCVVVSICISLSYSKIEDQIKYFPSSQIVLFKTCWDFTDYSNLLLFPLISVFLFLFSHMKWTLPMPLNRAVRNMFLDRSPCISPSSRVPQVIIYILRSKTSNYSPLSDKYHPKP